MFSTIRKGLVYTDIDPNIVEHDEDLDANEWSYNGRDVYRGQADPRYHKYLLNVYWLYDDDIQKVGLVEYDSQDESIFSVLWFKDNEYATLFQDDRWIRKDKTLWSIMPYEAYLDCLEDDFRSLFDRCLSSKYRLVTPKFLINPPTIYHCTTCNKLSLQPLSCKTVQKKNYFEFNSFLFVDDSFILYERVVKPAYASSGQERSEQPAQESPPQETQGEEPPLQESPQPQPPQSQS